MPLAPLEGPPGGPPAPPPQGPPLDPIPSPPKVPNPTVDTKANRLGLDGLRVAGRRRKLDNSATNGMESKVQSKPIGGHQTTSVTSSIQETGVGISGTGHEKKGLKADSFNIYGCVFAASIQTKRVTVFRFFPFCLIFQLKRV